MKHLHLSRLGFKARALFVFMTVWAGSMGFAREACAGELEAELSAETEAGGVWRQDMSLSLNLNWVGVFAGDTETIFKKEWPWDAPEQGTLQLTGRWKIQPEKTSRVGLEINSRWEDGKQRLAGTAEFSQRLAAPGTRMVMGVSGEKLSDSAGGGGYRLWQWEGEMVYREEGGSDLPGLTWLDNAFLYPWPGDREGMYVQDTVSLMDLYAHWLQVMEDPQETGRVRVKKLGSYKQYTEKNTQSSSYDYGSVTVTQPLKGGWTLTTMLEAYSRVYSGVSSASYETRKGQAGVLRKNPGGTLSLEQGLLVKETRYLYAPEKDVVQYGVYAEGAWKVTRSVKFAWESRLEMDQEAVVGGQVRLDLGVRRPGLSYGGFTRWAWEENSQAVWGVLMETGGEVFKVRLTGEVSSTGDKDIRLVLSRSF